jgi:hypothetical protein
MKEYWHIGVSLEKINGFQKNDFGEFHSGMF